MMAPDGQSSDDEAVAADVQLIRRVRLRLVAWSGGVTLVVLVVLGAVLYAAVARSLEASSLARLEARAEALSRSRAITTSTTRPPSNW